MAFEKNAISILAGNLNSSRSYLITAVGHCAVGYSIFDANSKNVFEGFSQSNRNQLGNLTRDKRTKE